MRRLLPRLSLTLLLLALLLVGGRKAQRIAAERQINRPLRVTLVLADQTLSVALFRARWDPTRGGALRITHRDAPERVLWQTLPGQGFVAAAQGSETVEEARGMFFFAIGCATSAPSSASPR